jgi:hypothetical protein
MFKVAAVLGSIPTYSNTGTIRVEADEAMLLYISAIYGLHV